MPYLVFKIQRQESLETCYFYCFQFLFFIFFYNNNNNNNNNNYYYYYINQKKSHPSIQEIYWGRQSVTKIAQV